MPSTFRSVKKDAEANLFKYKDPIILNINNHIRFNGSTIKKWGCELLMTHDRQLNNLQPLDPKYLQTQHLLLNALEVHIWQRYIGQTILLALQTEPK